MTDAEIQRGMTAFLEEKGETTLLEMPYVMPEEPVELPGTGEIVDTVLDMRFERDKRTRPKQAMFRWQLMTDGLVWRTKTDPSVWIFVKGGMASDEQIIRLATPDEIAHLMKLPRGWEQVAQVDRAAEPVARDPETGRGVARKKRPKKKSLLKRFFGESLTEDQESYKLASTQCPLPEEVTNAILEYRGFITDEDLDDEDGYGDDPHVTVLYGLKDADLPQVIDILGEMEPIGARVLGAGLFENETQDVVILELESEGLHALHEALGQIPHETTHPDYKPHLTVAYVKKGLGEKYRDLNCEGLAGRTFILDQVEFSATDGETTPIPLGGDVMKSVVGAHSMTAGKSAVPGESVAEQEVEFPSPGVYRPGAHHLLGTARDRFGATKTEFRGEGAKRFAVLVFPSSEKLQRYITWLKKNKHGDKIAGQRGSSMTIRLPESVKEQEEQGPIRTGPGPVVYAREGKRGSVVILDMKTREDAEKTRAELKKGQIGSVSLSGRERSQVMIQSLLSYEKLEPYILEALDEAGLTEQSPLFGVDVTEQYGMYCWDEIEEALDRYGLDSGKILGVLKRSIRPVRFTPYMDFSVGDIRDAIRNAGNTEGDAEDVTRMLSTIQTSVMTGVAEDVEDDVREALAPVLDRANRRLVSLRRSGDDFIGLLDSGRSIEIRKAGDLPVLGDFVILFGTEEYDPMSPTSVEELVRELQSPPVGEDTYTSDVAITDVIPITKGGKKVVKLPGLKRERIRRKTKRKYLRLGESMSRGESLISLVLRPDVIGVLDEKPVWGALHESGVIEAKPFKMGVEEFMEVRIDTSRKEWGEANVTALLDEVGSVDLSLQRQIQEQGDPGQVADDIENWVQTAIVDYARSELYLPSPKTEKIIRAAKLRGVRPDAECLAEELYEDPEVVHEVIMLRDPSDEVMRELAKSQNENVAKAAKLHFTEAVTERSLTEMTDEEQDREAEEMLKRYNAEPTSLWLYTDLPITERMAWAYLAADEFGGAPYAGDEVRRFVSALKEVVASPKTFWEQVEKKDSARAEYLKEMDWALERVPLGEVGVYPHFGGFPREWSQGSLVDTAVAVATGTDEPAKRHRVLEMTDQWMTILKFLPPILVEGGTLRGRDSETYEATRWDVDDGNHRLVAAAIGGAREAVCFVGRRKTGESPGEVQATAARGEIGEQVKEQETTDPAANLGSMGMPGGNPMQATVGEQEPPDQMAAVSSRTWTPGAMFKLHVLSPETGAGEWVYREVVGHEGEGDQSLIVYKTQEGRVMRLPHTQVDDAVGFGGAVGPERLGVKTGETPGDEEPVPPMGEVEEQAPSPEAQQLERDPRFAQALTKYQRSRDERDWEDVRKEAARVLRSEGPEVDRAVGQYAMTEEDTIMKPVTEKKDFKGKKKTVAGREVEEPTHLKSLAKKAGVSLNKALTAWGEAQKSFEKAHPDVKKGTGRYYKGVTGFMKARLGLPTKPMKKKGKKEQVLEQQEFTAYLVTISGNEIFPRGGDSNFITAQDEDEVFTQAIDDLDSYAYSGGEDLDQFARGVWHPIPLDDTEILVIARGRRSDREMQDLARRAWGEGVSEGQSVSLFTEDARFNDLLTRHEATKRDAYLTLAAERAARLAAIPIHEARELVEEIVKKTAKLFEGAGQ